MGLLPLVKGVASRMRGHLPPQVEFDDLVQEGTLGLIDALSRFDHSRHVKIETYARHRIRGAILDGLRALDTVSRGVRRKARKIESAYENLQRRQGRPATDPEISRAMNMSLRDWYRTARELRAAGWEWWQPSRAANPIEAAPAVEELQATGLQDDPFEQCYRGEQREVLRQLRTQLPERHRLVMALYYDQQLSMKEIGKRLGVDESRISQLHSSALQFLKAQAGKALRVARPIAPRSSRAEVPQAA